MMAMIYFDNGYANAKTRLRNRLLSMGFAKAIVQPAGAATARLRFACWNRNNFPTIAAIPSLRLSEEAQIKATLTMKDGERLFCNSFSLLNQLHVYSNCNFNFYFSNNI